MEFVNPGVLGSLNVFRTVYETPILRSREPGAKVRLHATHDVCFCTLMV